MGTSARGFSKLLSGLILVSTLAVGCSSGGGNALPASDSSSSSSSSSGAMTDATPDAFSFTPKRDVEVNTAIDSDAITITGIDAAAPVEITPPAEYQIDDGAFTSEPGSVSNNQTITVRLSSAAKAEQTTSATLTVGDQTATFDVTTAADMTAPEVAIQFPPPASMTEGNTIYIRGESSDLHGSVANITINGEMVTTEDDYATWSVELPLAEGENTLTVTATDMAGNVNDGEAVSVRKVADIAGESFPDNENPFEGPLYVEVGISGGKPAAFITDDTALAIFRVDLATGARVILSGNASVSESVAFRYPWSPSFDSVESVYVSDNDVPAVFKVDIPTGMRTVVSDSNSPENLMIKPRGIAFGVIGGTERIYVADERRIYWLNPLTGAQNLLSSAELDVPDNAHPLTGAFDLVIDYDGNRLVVVDSGVDKKILSVDLSDGARTLIPGEGFSFLNAIAIDHLNGRFLVLDSIERRISAVDDLVDQKVLSDDEVPNGDNRFVDPWGLATFDGIEYALVADPVLRAVLAVDLHTGKRVVVSKSVN